MIAPFKYDERILYDAALAADIATSVEAEEVVINESESSKSIIIVDSTLSSNDFDNLDSESEYIFVEQGETLADISAKLANHSDNNAIHIYSHGNTGSFLLAGEVFDIDSIQNNSETIDFLNTIKGSLSEDGDLLLYGCNTGEDAAGLKFVQLLANLTEADIAASNDITGSQEFGGDWDLEIEEGEIETEAIEATDYDGELATFFIEPGQSQLVRIKLSRDTPNSDSFQGFTTNISIAGDSVTPPSGSENKPDNVSYRYNSDPNFRGTVQVTTRWKMVGGGRGSSTTFQNVVTTFVIGSNELPTGQDQEVDATEDTSFTFSESDFSDGFADDDADDVFERIRIDSDPTGSLSLDGSAVNSGDIIQAADLDRLQFLGDLNANGDDADSFTFSVGDDEDFSDTPNTMTINLDAVNDPPVIRTGSPAETGIATAAETTPEDNSLTLTISDYVDDVDGDLLTLDGLGTATNGTVTDNGDGTITFNPDLNFFGGDTVIITVTDGEFDLDVEISVEVTPVNDAPTGQDQNVTATEDEDFLFNVTDFSNGYSDVEGDLFSNIRIDSLPNGDFTLDGADIIVGDSIAVADIGRLTYKAPENANGNGFTSFTFSVGDGTDFSDTPNTMTINVEAVNDPPVIRIGSPAETGIATAAETTPEDNLLTLTISDYVDDVDGDLLTLDGLGTATNGTITDNGDGTITFNPDLNYFGPDTLIVTVTDGEFDLDIEIPVEVTPVNDAPEAVDDATTTNLNKAITIDAKSNDFDIENDPITITRIISVSNGSASTDGSNITFNPNNNFLGTAEVTYELSDGDKVSTATVTIEVINPIDFIASGDDSGNSQFSAGSDVNINTSYSEITFSSMLDGEYNHIQPASFQTNFSAGINEGEYAIAELRNDLQNLHSLPSLDNPSIRTDIENILVTLPDSGDGSIIK